ncbi:MAG TPA: hypothetical protein VFB06_00325 [Streptosporangiaceae bacterium]|nr:hypothetical protein [Streptosporangiaceae bacterium]
MRSAYPARVQGQPAAGAGGRGEQYLLAARMTLSVPERHYLESRASRASTG